MKKLNDGTEVPDIIRYLVIEYRDRHLIEFQKEFGIVSLAELTKKQFIDYADRAYNWYRNFIKESIDGNTNTH